MARLVGTELPDDLYRRLRDADLDACAEKVILICTVDENGWPHPAMLSYFEVIAKDRHNVRLAPYKNSGTTNNMRRNGRLTISIIDERIAYYVKGRVQELQYELACWPPVSKFNLRVEQVLSDQADAQLEPGAYVAGGVTYKNPNWAAERARAQDVLRELLE